jgi:hypothetical protein
MNTRMLKRIAPAVVSLAVLAWLMRSIDLNALEGVLTWRVAAVLIPALLAYAAVTLLLEAVSITQLVDVPREEFSTWTAARLKCASYLLGIVNYALGVGAFAVLLRRHSHLSLSGAASLVLLITSTDIVVVLAMAGTCAAMVETSAPTVQAGVIVAAFLGFFGGLALLRIPGSLGPLDRIRSLAIFEGLRTIPVARLGQLLALRTCFAASLILLFAASFYAFGIRTPIPELIVGVLVVAVVAGIPIAVAGLGTSQAAFLFIFADYAPQELLLAQSLIVSTGMLALRGLMGLVFARAYTGEALLETRTGASV